MFGKSKKSLKNSSDISSLKEKYINVFEKENRKNPWKSPEELSNITKTSVSDVYFTLKNSREFVKNTNGQILSRKKYEEITPFVKKLYDQIINKIK